MVAPKNRHSGEQGFTLIELIVVCALVGIFLSLAVPTVRDTVFSDPLKGSTRKLIGFISELREGAVRNQLSYLLHISRIEKRIWYEEDGVVQGEKSDEPAPEKRHSFSLPDSVHIGEIWIGGEGSAVEDKTVVWISDQGLMHSTMIQLVDREGETLTVHFLPFIDTPRISEHFEIPEQRLAGNGGLP